MAYWKCCILLLGLLSLAIPVFAQDPTAAPADADLPLGKLVYVAKFLKEPNWEEGMYNDETLIWEPVAEGLSIESTSADAPSRYVPGTAYLATNFYAEMTFTPIECATPESAIILNVRSDPTAESPTLASAYAFVMECDGTYRSRAVNEGESGLIDLMGDLPQALTLGEPVSLGILMNGRSAIWYINGEEMGNYFATSAPVEGQFALGAQLGMKVIVNDLRVWQLTEDSIPVDNPEAQNASDPLRERQPGRNIVVETFEHPNNPLIAARDASLAGIRVGDTVITTAHDPLTVRYLAEPPDPATYPSSYTEVVFQIRNCADDGAFGLVLGTDENDFTLIGVQCDGTFFARPNGESDSFVTGRVDPPQGFVSGHTLGMVVDGTMVYTYFDSTLMGSFELANAEQQRIGLVWLSGGSPLTEVTVDNFSVVELLEP